MPAMFDCPVRMKRCAGLSAAEAESNGQRAKKRMARCFVSMGVLIDIDELVGIQEHAAVGEEVDGLRGGEFFGRRIALEA